MTRLEPHLYFGLDLGRRRSRTVLACLERTHEATGGRDAATYEPVWRLHLVVRLMETFEQGLAYLEVVRRVARLLNEPRRLGGWELAPGHTLRPHQTLVVDASGVGAPVTETLRAAGLNASLRPITITGTGEPRADGFGGTQVSRRDLLDNLRLLVERGVVRVPGKLGELDRLEEEWLRVGERGGAAPDDRVMALSLAAWQASRGLAAWMVKQTERR